MNEADLVTAILTIRQQVGFLWNFYVTACVFLIGWVFSSKTVWNETKRKVIIGLFSAFVVTNLSAIYQEYSLLQAATEQLSYIAKNQDPFLSRLASDTGLGPLIAAVIHLSADAFIVYLINFRCRANQAQE
ncbi:hypothetical protein [Paraglaciecola aestuariivivens]